MLLTFIGAIQAIIAAALLLFGSVPAMFVFVLASGMFGGSAAITLPALGGSTIPPIQFALVFMMLRMIVPGAGQMPRLRDALRANGLLLAFVAYGIVLAYLGPRIFEHQIDVTPLRGRVEARYVNTYAFIYSTRSLEPSTQNATTAIYLVGTLLLALSTYVACTYERGRDLLVKTGVVIAFVHVALGFGGILSRDTPLEQVFDLFRNGNYAQINNAYKGFVRINGIFPEASSYALYAFVWLVFNFECWFRGIRPFWTGLAALALAGTLAFSTSTTAYVSLGLYAAIFGLRSVIFPNSLTLSRALVVGAAGLLMTIVIATVMLLSPAFARDFYDLIEHVTVDKADSLSGTQRRFWAQQGIDAFLYTKGIGIGPGSFRSSSLLSAIAGCMGLVGLTTFGAYLLGVWKPLRATTYFPNREQAAAVGGAASWAAFAITLSASLISPTCDPGPEFAAFAGAALALRSRSLRSFAAMVPTPPAPEPPPALIEGVPRHA